MKRAKTRRERRERAENPVVNFLRPIVIGAVVGAAVCMVLLIGLSFALVVAKRMPQGVIPPITVFISALGALFAGYVAAKISRERGLLYGACAALLLFLLLFLAGLAITQESMSAFMATKGLIMVLIGAIAGIWAVNRRSKRK